MGKLKVLFLCQRNTARSQMAEGLLRHFYSEKYESFSAGIEPTQINRFAIKAMAEIGIDISNQFSKSIKEFQEEDLDLVASVCRSSPKIVCSLCSSPMPSGRPEIVRSTLPKAKHYLENGFDDPSEVKGTEEEKMKAFRRTRDDIKKWILETFARFKN